MKRKVPSLLQKHQNRRFLMESEYTRLRSDLIRENQGFYGFPVDPISFGYVELVLMLSILRRANLEYSGGGNGFDAQLAYAVEQTYWEIQIPERKPTKQRKSC